MSSPIADSGTVRSRPTSGHAENSRWHVRSPRSWHTWRMTCRRRNGAPTRRSPTKNVFPPAALRARRPARLAQAILPPAPHGKACGSVREDSHASCRKAHPLFDAPMSGPQGCVLLRAAPCRTAPGLRQPCRTGPANGRQAAHSNTDRENGTTWQRKNGANLTSCSPVVQQPTHRGLPLRDQSRRGRSRLPRPCTSVRMPPPSLPHRTHGRRVQTTRTEKPACRTTR